MKRAARAGLPDVVLEQAHLRDGEVGIEPRDFAARGGRERSAASAPGAARSVNASSGRTLWKYGT